MVNCYSENHFGVLKHLNELLRAFAGAMSIFTFKKLWYLVIRCFDH